MAISKELLKGSTTLLILRLLQGEDMYGYEMVHKLEERSDQTFTLKEGTLYPILHALEKAEAISAYWVETGQGRKRKYYKITEKGLKLLEDKKKEWEEYSNAMNQVLEGEYIWLNA